MTEKDSILKTSESGGNAQHCENYHLYMVTLKPNWRSYIKKSYQDSTFMLNVFGIFMRHFCTHFRYIDSGIEYDEKGTCHIHIVFASLINFLKFSEDGISITNIINFMKGIYVDFRILPREDLDHVIQYINKGEKTDKIMDYYRNNYGFV